MARRVIDDHLAGPPMSTPSRIPQIIAHERAIHRSLTPFALALAFLPILLLVLAVRG
jgi:hypothetical protein